MVWIEYNFLTIPVILYDTTKLKIVQERQKMKLISFEKQILSFFFLVYELC